MLNNPCHGCTERIIPTKENNLATCHGNCEREAEYQEQTRRIKDKRSQEIDESRYVYGVWAGRKKRIKKSNQN